MARPVSAIPIALAVLLLLSPAVASSSQTEDVDAFKDIPQLVDRLLLEWHVPGAAIGVVKDGAIVYMRGFGYRDVENKLKADERTLFCIGSCSKAFTSLAAAILVDEGKLDWDTPVIEYVPDFRLYDEYATRHATIRDLLCHRTGVASHDELWKKSPFSRAELFRRLRYLQPIGEFRSTFEYSNLMSMAAGHILGRINGGSWEELIEKRILSPLEMKRFRFSIGQAESDANFAHPYRHDGTAFQTCWYHVMDAIAPAGGVTTCVEDMCTWLLLHLNEGKYSDKALVSQKNLRETHKPHVMLWSDGLEVEPFGAYCLGWVYSLFRGQRSLAHDGGTRGYQAVVQILPEKRLGLVFVSNAYGHYVDYIVLNTLVERFVGVEERDWNEHYRKRKSEPEEEVRHPQHDLIVPVALAETLVGRYEHPGYGTAAVALRDGRLRFTYNTNDCEMAYTGFNNFRLSSGWYRGLRLSVTLDLEGEVLSLAIPLQKGVDDIVFRRVRDKR
jgi:CubicO group peptidase (beta-lactamase class C family)